MPLTARISLLLALMAPSVRKPALAAAVFFVALAVLIARLAIAPLGAADLLGIAACAAAAGAFATLAFTQLPSRTRDSHSSEFPPAQRPTEVCHQFGDKSSFDPEALATRIATAVEARLAAAETTRLAAQHAAIAATTPPRALDTDTLPAPASGAKPRLGRGLLGLMHAPSALSATAQLAASSPAPSASSQDDRAAA